MAISTRQQRREAGKRKAHTEETKSRRPPKRKRRSILENVANSAFNFRATSKSEKPSENKSNSTVPKSKHSGSSSGIALGAMGRRQRSNRKKIESQPPASSPNHHQQTTPAATCATIVTTRTTATTKSEWSVVEDTSEKNRYANFVEDGNHRLVRVPLDPSKFIVDIARHDLRGPWQDPRQVTDYATDLFQRLYHSETLSRVHLSMDNQSEVTSDMRYILVDWLVDVHMKFHFLPETFYLTVQLIDRFLEKTNVRRKFFQLLGTSCMLIAAKYHECCAPTVRDCVYITDGCYTRQEVIDMEADILETLNYELSYPTAHPFCQRFLFLVRASRTRQLLANYYLEFAIHVPEFFDFRPSLVAAAAVCLALNQRRIRGNFNRSGYPEILLEYTGFRKMDIRKVAKLFCKKLSGPPITLGNRRLRAVYSKYSLENHGRVACLFDQPKLEGLAHF